MRDFSSKSSKKRDTSGLVQSMGPMIFCIIIPFLSMMKLSGIPVTPYIFLILPFHQELSITSWIAYLPNPSDTIAAVLLFVLLNSLS